MLIILKGDFLLSRLDLGGKSLARKVIDKETFKVDYSEVRSILGGDFDRAKRGNAQAQTIKPPVSEMRNLPFYVDMIFDPSNLQKYTMGSKFQLPRILQVHVEITTNVGL